MNKFHMLALIGLLLCGVNGVSAMGQEQREILYTLHALGQNFADVPMIFQNIDMYIGIAEMHKQLKEIELKAANKALKNAVVKNTALLGGILLAQNFSWMGLGKIRNYYSANSADTWQIRHVLEPIRAMLTDGFVVSDLLGLVTIGKVFAALNVYDAWKKRSELMQALALDTEILDKLQEVKASENIFLKSAE